MPLLCLAFRRWAITLILPVLAILPGCMHSAQHLVEQAPLPCCDPVSPCPRQHVYILLIDGLNLMQVGELTTLRHDLYIFGYCKSLYGQCCHGHWFQEQMQAIHKHDPAARFVLIASGWGVHLLPSLTEFADKNDIPVDLIVASRPGMEYVEFRNETEIGMTQVWEVPCLLDPDIKHRLIATIAEISGGVPIIVPGLEGQAPGYELAPMPREMTPSGVDPLGPVYQLPEVPIISVPERID